MRLTKFDSTPVIDVQLRAVIAQRQSRSIGFIDAASHVYKRVCPSVGPLVGPSVTLSSESREINIFRQKSDKGGILGSLNASLNL